MGGLRDWGRVVLTSGYLGKADRAVVEQAVKRLRSAEPKLLAALTAISDPASARKLLHQIAEIAGSAYVVGAHGAMTETSNKFFKKSQAALARSRRPESGRERDLAIVIENKLGGAPSKNPYKDADRLLPDVNKEMNARGHKRVSLSALYRRLKRAHQSEK